MSQPVQNKASFIWQVADADLENEYAFARNLNRKLPKCETAGLPVGVTDAVDLDSFRIPQTFEGRIKRRR